MPDQTVAIESDSGSRYRVAFDLMRKVIDREPNGKEMYRSKQEIIDLYVDCLWAMSSDRTGGR